MLNDVQYFYITNLSGDVVGITDANGNVIARYSYDEWGRLLSIDTAEDDNEEQQAIAEINPLRYRGYYYDTETGMYYLQSRYYNPELCRFISADDFSYINSNRLSINAYIYCQNNSLKYIDPTGHDLTWNTIFDIIAEILIFDQISMDMKELFGENFTAKFFEFLGELFSLVPSISKLVLDIVKTIPEYIWEVLRDIVQSINIGDIINDLAISFSKSFITLAKDAAISASKNFLMMFSTWGIGYFPVQLLILAPGILLDKKLSSNQKFTLLFLDSFSIIGSEIISILNTVLNPNKILSAILDAVSFLLPITTDLIARIMFKKNNKVGGT